MTDTPAISINNLVKRYAPADGKRGGEAKLALKGVSFDVPRGSTLGLLGGNGAGKTTTIAMLLGLLIPTSGSIHVLGHDMATDRFAALARMNFSSPYVALPGRLTVAQNLRVYAHLYGVRGREARIGVAAERVVRVEAEQLPVLAQVLLLRLRAMVGAGTASRLDSRRNGCTLRDLN